MDNLILICAELLPDPAHRWEAVTFPSVSGFKLC